MRSALQQHAENLRALRELRGYSFTALSTASTIPEQALRDAEDGRFSFELMAHLADFYQLDIDFLTSDTRLGDGQPESVFFFQGASTALYREDLPTLNRVAQRARLFVNTTDHGREGLKRRQRFEPQPLASDQQGSAARQGYRLARYVRAALGLGAVPIADLGGLLTQELGVLIADERLTDLNYQACAVLDQARSAAAILLSSASPERDQATLLRRVYLAHELCHLLFDVTPTGAITISTDSARDDAKIGVEQRARAFCAELLIPRDGLIQAFGEPRHRPFEQAVTLVDQARSTFGAPWRVAVNHLKNMGYIDEAARFTLEGEQTRPSAPRWPTESTVAQLEAKAARSPQSQLAPEELAEQVWGTARAAAGELAEALDAECDAALATVAKHLSSDQSEHAKMVYLSSLDRALRRSSIGLAQRLLSRHDLVAGPAGAITGALMVTRPAKELLGATRDDYLRRAEAALAEHHGWSAERIEAAARRLA